MKVQEDTPSVAMILPPTASEIDEMLATIAWPCEGEVLGPPELQEVRIVQAELVTRAALVEESERQRNAMFSAWEQYDLPDGLLMRLVNDRIMPSHLRHAQAICQWTKSRTWQRILIETLDIR